jgi:adenylate cyclase
MGSTTAKPGTEIPAAILFADVGGSTQLYDTLGDVRAHEITRRCLEQVIGVVRNHGGSVIKTIGDEVMSTFPSADQAAEASCAIQLSMAEAGEAGAERIGLHVGFHYGPVLPEGEDIFGDTVNVAARMVSLAKSGQIITTLETVQAMNPELRARTRQIDHRPVKGKREELDICEVIWETADLTQLTEVPEEARIGRLALSFGSLNLVLSPASPSCSIGRDSDNDIVLDDARASRHHARIELRQGKFVLYDTSTNGTLVRSEQGQPVFLRREELILPEAGTLNVGPAPALAELIRFRFED